MADADREIGVKVTTSAELGGLQQADKEAQKFSKTTEQAGDAAEKATAKKIKLRDVVKGLALEFPQLARVVGFMANPVTAVTAAVTAGIAAWSNYINKVAELGRAQAAIESLGDGARSFAQHAKEVERSSSEFADSLREIGETSQNAATWLERMNAALEKQRELQDKLEDIQLAKEKALIQEKGEREGLPRSQIMAMEAAAEERARQRKAARELAASEGKVGNIQKAIAAEDQIIGGFKPNDDLLSRLRRDEEDQKLKLGEVDKLKEEAQKLRDKIAGFGAEREAFEKSAWAVSPRRQFTKIDPSLLPTPGNLRVSTKDEVRAGIDMEQGEAEKELQLKLRMIEDRQRSAFEAEERRKNAEEERKRGQERVRGAMTRREGFEGQLRQAQDELELRRRFIGQALPEQSAADRAKAAAEKAKEDREQREKDRRERDAEERKTNRVLEEERRKEKVRGFKGDFGAVSDPSALLEQLLAQHEQIVTTINEVLATHAGKMDILEQRIAENEV